MSRARTVSCWTCSFTRGDVRNRWYSATVRVNVDTYVFKFVPVLNRFIDQRGSAVVQF